MSEEQAEQQAEQQQTEQPPETPAEQQQEKANGEGTEFVEFDDPKIAARFKRVYGNMKHTERVLGEMAKDNKALWAKLQEYETRTEAQSVERTVDSLISQREKAIEAGDLPKVVELSDQIAEARIKKIEKKEPPRDEQGRFVAQESGGMSEQDQTTVLTWANETDADGRLLRPWSQESHTGYKRMLRAMQAAADDMTDLPEILEEVDRLMGKPEKKQAERPIAAVLSSRESGKGKDAKPKLTSEETMVAKKMDMTPEQYAKAKEKWSK